jgi:serine/threonine protein kinase
LNSALVFPWAETSFLDSARHGLVDAWTGADHLAFARTLLNGLAALHDKALVHGDMRPCNILASDNPRRPQNYALAEFGRFPSHAAVKHSGTYILQGECEKPYAALPELEQPWTLSADVLITRRRAGELLLIAGMSDDLLDNQAPKLGLFDRFPTSNRNVLARDGHWIVSGDARTRSRHPARTHIHRCREASGSALSKVSSPR